MFDTCGRLSEPPNTYSGGLHAGLRVRTHHLPLVVHGWGVLHNDHLGPRLRSIAWNENRA